MNDPSYVCSRDGASPWQTQAVVIGGSSNIRSFWVKTTTPPVDTAGPGGVRAPHLSVVS